MNLGYKNNSSLKKINYIESYLCFFTFGFLVGISKEEFNIIVRSISTSLETAVGVTLFKA